MNNNQHSQPLPMSEQDIVQHQTLNDVHPKQKLILKPRAHVPVQVSSQDEKTIEFINKAINKFGNTLDYSRTVYKNASTKLVINCPKHGSFEQTPLDHLRSSVGCPLCA